MELNNQQQQAKTLILDFIGDNQDDNFFLLSGYAGTGKSTTITDIIATYQQQQYSWIAMCAPTHKATQVLRRKGNERGSHNIDYSTIHQLLGLTAEIDYNTGEQVFTQVGNNNLKKYDLVVIDECSMIDSELWGIIQSEVYTHDKKVVLLGDKAQLPPINDPISPIFSESIPHFELTEVMRTNNLNPLADIINDCRLHKLCDNSVFSSDMTQGAWLIEDKKAWLNTLLRSFKSPQYKNNPDYAKAIAWTNRAVNYINNFCRDELLDYPDCPFIEGERLVANDHIHDYRDTSEILCHNSSEFTILKVKPKLDEPIPHYWMRAEDDDGNKFPILVVADNNKFTQQLKSLAQVAHSTLDQKRRKDAWKNYWDFKHQFANVNYTYAITSHKSQGSTYDNAFVAQTNIMSNPKRSEAFQSLYVAYSRASQRLFINH